MPKVISDSILLFNHLVVEEKKLIAPFVSAGKATRGYDPASDIVWLRSEIVRWVLGNLMDKW